MSADKLWYVYRLKCLSSGKSYIGISCDPKRRWRQYRDTQAIYHAIKKHGIDNFAKDVIYCSRDRQHILEMERHFIAKFNTSAPKVGYNLTLGGDGSMGRAMPPNKRKLLSAKLKGHLTSKQTRVAISNALLGHPALKRPFTSSHRKKLSESMRGKFDGARNPRAVDWIVWSPDGEVDFISDLVLFCKDFPYSANYVREYAKHQRTLPNGYLILREKENA